MAIRKVGVVGCGLMGSGIAQTCAQIGYDMLVLEVNQPLLDKGLGRIHDAWKTMASKGKLTPQQVEENMARLHGTLELADFADRDLVIEVVLEQMEEKLRLFPALDKLLKPEALILSNTSSLNITQMGAITRRPDKVCGLHFLNCELLNTLFHRSLVTVLGCLATLLLSYERAGYDIGSFAIQSPAPLATSENRASAHS